MIQNPESNPNTPNLQPEPPEAVNSKEFSRLAHEWQTLINQADDEVQREQIIRDALAELNEIWQSNGKFMDFVGRLVQAEFDDEGEETGELFDSLSTATAVSHGVTILDMDGRPTLAYLGALPMQVYEDTLKQSAFVYKLYAPIETAQLFRVAEKPRGELARRIDVDLRARRYNAEYERMINSRGFFQRAAEPGYQRHRVEELLERVNNKLHDPKMLIIADCQTTKFYRRAWLETPYGFQPTEYDEQTRITGVYLGFTSMESEILQTQALYSQQDMIDPDAGLCAVVVPHRIGNKVIEDEQPILIPLGYSQNFHTYKPGGPIQRNKAA